MKKSLESDQLFIDLGLSAFLQPKLKKTALPKKNVPSYRNEEGRIKKLWEVPELWRKAYELYCSDEKPFRQFTYYDAAMKAGCKGRSILRCGDWIRALVR